MSPRPCMDPDHPEYANDAIDATDPRVQCRHGVRFTDFKRDPCLICLDDAEWYTRDEGAR